MFKYSLFSISACQSICVPFGVVKGIGTEFLTPDFFTVHLKVILQMNLWGSQNEIYLGCTVLGWLVVFDGIFMLQTVLDDGSFLIP